MSTVETVAFGRTYKGKRGAENEAARWMASGDGVTAPHKAWRDGVFQLVSIRTVTAEARPVEGGFACAYITTDETP